MPAHVADENGGVGLGALVAKGQKGGAGGPIPQGVFVLRQPVFAQERKKFRKVGQMLGIHLHLLKSRQPFLHFTQIPLLDRLRAPRAHQGVPPEDIGEGAPRWPPFELFPHPKTPHPGKTLP
jgi:hypothetical protein